MDKIVCEEILKFDVDGSWMKDQLESLRHQIDNGGSVAQYKINALKDHLERISQEMETCFNIFSIKSIAEEMVTMANERMRKLTQEKAEIDKRIFELEEADWLSRDFGSQINMIMDALQHFKYTFHTASVHDKRLLLRAIIEKIEWDGNDMHIFLFGESA